MDDGLESLATWVFTLTLRWNPPNCPKRHAEKVAAAKAALPPVLVSRPRVFPFVAQVH